MENETAMTLRRFYREAGGDADEVLARLGSEEMLRRFLKKFPGDPSFSELCTAFRTRDAETAFRAAHTLKGLCLNLGFGALCRPATLLTEALRSRTFSSEADALFLATEKEYRALLLALAKTE